MLEKPSTLEGIEKFAPGMRVMKIGPIGPRGMDPEYFEILDINSNRVKLRSADCGKIIDIDPEYFIDNYACIDTVKPKIAVEDHSSSPTRPAGNGKTKVGEYKCATHEKVDKIIFN